MRLIDPMFNEYAETLATKLNYLSSERNVYVLLPKNWMILHFNLPEQTMMTLRFHWLVSSLICSFLVHTVILSCKIWQLFIYHDLGSIEREWIKNRQSCIFEENRLLQYFLLLRECWRHAKFPVHAAMVASIVCLRLAKWLRSEREV
jgi:hypothetical protein